MKSTNLPLLDADAELIWRSHEVPASDYGNDAGWRVALYQEMPDGTISLSPTQASALRHAAERHIATARAMLQKAELLDSTDGR